MKLGRFCASLNWRGEKEEKKMHAATSISFSPPGTSLSVPFDPDHLSPKTARHFLVLASPHISLLQSCLSRQHLSTCSYNSVVSAPETPHLDRVLPPSLCCTAHSAWLLHVSWLPECNPSSLLPPTAWLNFWAERCLCVPINSNQIEPPRSHRGFYEAAVNGWEQKNCCFGHYFSEGKVQHFRAHELSFGAVFGQEM